MSIIQTGNLLLERLPLKSRDRIVDEFVQVDMVFADILCEPGQDYQYVYFPLTGFISSMVVVKDHPPLELGLIGNEGMLGATLAAGVSKVPHRGIVQGPGSALRMGRARFRQILRDHPSLIRILEKYQYVLLTQLTQIAACTHFHEVDARLARWLLMTHDCAQANNFHLTHKYLADMLGVQRSAVTIAAGILQKERLISYSRGEITILNRKGLEAVSCTCYAIIAGDYKQLFH